VLGASCVPLTISSRDIRPHRRDRRAVRNERQHLSSELW
jgi:hypothetical protein